jgi:DNA-binding NarL/FixJ family response regulator
MQLPPRQRQILNLILEGDSNKQIAQKIGSSVFTIKNQVSTILEAHGVDTRARLLAHYLKAARAQ